MFPCERKMGEVLIKTKPYNVIRSIVITHIHLYLIRLVHSEMLMCNHNSCLLRRPILLLRNIKLPLSCSNYTGRIQEWQIPLSLLIRRFRRWKIDSFSRDWIQNIRQVINGLRFKMDFFELKRQVLTQTTYNFLTPTN